MSLNLLETVQQNLHYQALQKVDPNTQEVVVDSTTPSEEKFSQAVIPSAILALYKYSTTENGSQTILQNKEHEDWPSIVFGDKKDEFFDNVCKYSHQYADSCETKINNFFRAVVCAINERQKNGHTDAEGVRKLLADQRNLVLPFLPSDIELGKILDDTTLDDRTNKMEGPVSNLMHSIGNIFSSSDKDEVPKPF